MDDHYKLPTDAHEDKWGKLGVSSKKNDLKSVDVDERLDDYISFSRHNISAGLSFQNQAYKDLSKQDDRLKSFNQKILKEFEDLKRVRYFPDKQYRFPVSNESVASSFVINPEQITPALKATEERIKALEGEMDHRERDMVKMNGVVELLVEENKYLRDHISSKNRDINKILETVGLNDGETTHDLRHRLSLLSEENNILLAHLEELRAVKENFERYSREKNSELNRASDEYVECRRSLEEALKREELLTNYKQMMDPKFRHSQEKVAELEATISDLVEELSQVKNQNVLMSNQIGSYKRNMDDLDGKNSLELDRLVQEVNILQNEKKEHKKIIEGKDKVLEDRQTELKKVRRDFEQTKLEFEEIVQVMNDLKNQLANERQTTETAVKREKELRDRNNKLADELEKLQSKIRKHEDEHLQLIESLKMDYTAKISKQETKVQKLKNKLDDREKKYKAEIGALKAQSEELARILETVSAEREDYFKRWEGLSRESHLFDERERMLGELENEISRINKELDKSRRELVDTEERYRSQNDDLRSESEKLNEINKELREELMELKRYLEEEHPVREKDTHNWRSARESTKAGTVETQRRRELGERDVNAQIRSRSNSPTRKDGGKSVSELEKENQYLHQMIKNLVQSENGAQSNYYGNNATDRTSGLSPLRTPDTRVYVGQIREGRLIEERPVEHVIRREHVVHTPVVEHVVHRPAEHVVLREEHRPITPVHHTTSVYPMRASMTASQYERQPRESVGTYTDLKKRESANVDTVISGILKKYNMEKIPDYVGKNKGLGGGQGDYSRRDNFESTREHVAPRADLGGSLRSPQMQFLSPLLSSPKYESKSGSLENSVAKADANRDKILSPEAIDVIQTLKRDKV